MTECQERFCAPVHCAIAWTFLTVFTQNWELFLSTAIAQTVKV